MPLDMKTVIRTEAALDQWDTMLEGFITTLCRVNRDHARRLLELVGSQANAVSIAGQYGSLCSSLNDLTAEQRDGFVHLIFVAAHCGLSRASLNQAKQFLNAMAENQAPGTKAEGSDGAS